MNRQLRLIFMSLLAIFVGGVSYGAEQVLLEYTVTDSSTNGTDLTAGNGKVYFGAPKFESQSWASGSYAFKSDGDVSGSKYALLKLASGETFKAGDVITVYAGATSSPSGSDYGIALYTANESASILTTLYLEAKAKNEEKELTYTVDAQSALVGKSEVYLFRATGKSTYISGAKVTRNIETGTTDPELDYSTDSYTATIGGTNVFPTLSYASGVSGITYSSSDEDIATINDNGEITLLSNGETTITASFIGNDNFSEGSASYLLTVVGGKTNIEMSFDPTSANGIVGAVFTAPTLTINPTGLAVTYSSSNETVATVDTNSGAITLIAEGTTTITASFAGNDNYNEATASYILNVEEPNAELVPVDSKTWDFSTWTNATYEKTKVVDNLEINGASGKAITINSKVLKFGGTGSTESRNVHFIVSGASKITVVAKHGGSGADRPLKINVAGEETTLGELKSGADASSLEYTYEGLLQADVYIYSGNSGINLSSITVEPLETGAPLTAAYEPAEISIMSNETLEQPTLTITDEAGEAVDGLTISYESDNTNVATVDETGAISLTGAAGEATITATIDGGDNYRSTTASVTITVIDANSVLTVTENTEVVLTKENIEAEGYMSASTDNWVTDKNYGGYEGDFYNMSKSDRKITIKVQGAKAFEVLVQNSTAGRTYQIAPGATSTTEITHQGGGVESSGIIECSGEQMELVISGGGTTAGSVYPVAIRFYTEVPEQIAISSVGYATLYYSDKAFEIPSGVTASIVTSVEGGKITFEELSEVIPAGTGVVLKGNEGTYNFTIATTQANAPENNLLRGSDEAATTTGGDLYYMLSLNANSDEGSVGFYWGDAEGGAFENGAHKAYLAVANSTDAKSFYLFEENTTGIDAVQGARLNAQGMEIYNLNGQRVMNARKGIYIVNGRKVVVR